MLPGYADTPTARTYRFGRPAGPARVTVTAGDMPLLTGDSASTASVCAPGLSVTFHVASAFTCLSNFFTPAAPWNGRPSTRRRIATIGFFSVPSAAARTATGLSVAVAGAVSVTPGGSTSASPV